MLWYSSQKAEDVDCSHRSLHTRAWNSLACERFIMETPQIVNNRRLQDKPQKEQANTRVMWRSLEGGTLSKRSQLQTATHCDSIRVPLLKWKISKKTQCHGLQELRTGVRGGGTGFTQKGTRKKLRARVLGESLHLGRTVLLRDLPSVERVGWRVESLQLC